MDIFAHHSTEHALFMNGTLLAVVVVGIAITLVLIVLAIKGKRS